MKLRALFAHQLRHQASMYSISNGRATTSRLFVRVMAGIFGGAAIGFGHAPPWRRVHLWRRRVRLPAEG